jgi:hypothetical protein
MGLEGMKFSLHSGGFALIPSAQGNIKKGRHQMPQRYELLLEEREA